MGVVYTIHRLVMLTGCCEWQRKGFYTALVTCAQKSAKFRKIMNSRVRAGKELGIYFNTGSVQHC